MLDGHPLEIALTATNSMAQAWYGYDQASVSIFFAQNITAKFDGQSNIVNQ